MAIQTSSQTENAKYNIQLDVLFVYLFTGTPSCLDYRRDLTLDFLALGVCSAGCLEMAFAIEDPSNSRLTFVVYQLSFSTGMYGAILRFCPALLHKRCINCLWHFSFDKKESIACMD
jgi:hypothetical protein